MPIRHCKLVSRVRRAMSRGELVLYCQPQVDCRTGRLLGAEALIRWQHPRHGLLAPATWLPQVEATRERTRLNLHIVELALAHRERWRAQGLTLPLAINVTPACLADERFVDRLEQLIGTAAAADAWRLEITEEATVLGGLAIDESVRRLRACGVEFMLDDFGAAYSSLSRLAMLPFGTLKIDGSLISETSRSRSHRSVTHAAIQLAHTLGLDAIGEAVEDAGTWMLLQALGCDQIQGHHIAKPMPAEDLPGFAASYVPAPPGAGRRRPERRTAERRTALQAWLGQERRSGVDRRAATERHAADVNR